MSSALVVVLDASVWISGVFFRRGIPARILCAWRDHHFEIVVTSETLAELERKLQEKTNEFGAHPGLAEEWVAYVRTFARTAPPTNTASGVCRDPDDDKFLDAALSGQAGTIASSDHDLQALGGYQSIKVLSPREFAELLGLISPFTSPSDT